MIDIHLMERLVRAVHEDARLVLLGDAQKLPSIGADAVLRDLVDVPALEKHTVRLTKSYRMDPSILNLARRISPEGTESQGPLEDVLAVRASAADVLFDRAEALFSTDGASGLRKLLERWYAERIASLPGFQDLVGRTYTYQGGAFDAESSRALATIFSHFERSRILCVTRIARTGSDAVSSVLRALHRARRRGRDDVLHAPGEPVLMTTNDYEKGIWNGDQGLALWVRAEEARPHLAAVFRRGTGFVPFPVELLLTREALYTAVTRGRKSVVVFGKRELLLAGIARTSERFSGAGERIAAASAALPSPG
jgi:exodeoxyribonuclease V alpha subunit